MAVSNTKKVNTTAPKTEAKTNVTLDVEKEALKKQIEELQAQMKMMADMVANSRKDEVKAESKKPERLIPFVNMTTGTAVIKGNIIYEIAGQFNSRKFLEREARIIVNNMKNAIDNGYIYIADADFVKECELDVIYRSILSDDMLKELLNHDASYVVETYKNVTDGQKQIIVDMLIDKKVKGEYVDANILIEIGKLANRDLINIEPEE